MKTFELVAHVGISVYTKVEAETLKEAIEIARERPLMSVSHSGGENEYEEWMCDELDGMPDKICEA